MANPNAAYGFRLLNEYGKQTHVRYYTKKTGNAIYQGDAVIQDAAGNVDVATAATLVILGIAAEYKAATDTSKIAVIDDPMAEFAVQCSADFAAADVFQNAKIVATAGNTSLKRSKHALDSANFATDATYPFKILGLLDQGVNAVGSYAQVKVKINQGAFSSGVAGV